MYSFRAASTAAGITHKPRNTCPRGAGQVRQGNQGLAPHLAQLLAAIHACAADATHEAIARTLPTLDDGLTVWLRTAARTGGMGSDVLAAFLADREHRGLEWPIATASRSHIHSRIDAAELPVSHVTRRQGRPYTLVLRKQDTLFTREREEHERDEADLTALERADIWGVTTTDLAARHRL